MSRRNRDYAAEYARRVARAMAKGASRSQARGHPRASEAPSKAQPAARSPELLEVALKAMRQGKSLTAAARAHHISAERLRHFLKQQRLVRRKGRTWVIVDRRLRRVELYSRRKQVEIVVRGYKAAALAGAYWHYAHQFVATNDLDLLTPFVGKGVKDHKGRFHAFETDPNAIHRLAAAGGPAFYEIYRLVT